MYPKINDSAGALQPGPQSPDPVTRSRVGSFVRQHRLSRAMRHAAGAARQVYGDDVQLLEPAIRREVLDSGAYLHVVVEVPAMPEAEFVQKYDAFMEGVWGGMKNLDPALITFSVRSRVPA